MSEFTHISDILKAVLEDISKNNFDRLTDNFSEEEKKDTDQRKDLVSA